MVAADTPILRFELSEAAGSGGMGTVYRAYDNTTGNVVAVKVLHDLGEEQVSRFGYEARILEAIEHPHVARYITHGVLPAGEPFLAMEWLEGVNLAVRLKGKRLGIEETMDLGRRVASALDAVHARGIVHRDIKPSNLFLPRGEIQNVKLLDFGIAHVDRATTALTRTGMLIGTPGYMAPEQAKGERIGVDGRSDVFSLGCVLFECLTGQPAFQGVHVIALLAKLLLDEPPHVRELRPEVPALLDDLIYRMLSKEPENRPADGNAVIAALERVRIQESIQPSLPPVPLQSLTHTEKRLVSAVVVVPPKVDNDQTLDTTKDSEDTLNVLPIPNKRLADMRRAVQAFGAKLEEIANGMFVALLVGTGPATDQVAIAARCALRMQWALPQASMVLLTRRGNSTGRLPVGEVFEHAGSLLQKVQGVEFEGVICIDEVTRALLDVRFDVIDDRDRIVLRGERDVGAEARTLLGKPSPFVGRDRELRHLLELVDDALEEGVARVAVVSAEPGIGKSRLRYEFVQRLRSGHSNLVIAIGRGDSISAGSAFSLVGSAFRSSLGIALDEPLENRRTKLSAMVGQYFTGQDLWRIAGFLGEMIGIPFADEDENDPRVRAARQNPTIMADQIQSAYVNLVRAVVTSTPLLLVLEDMHWGDGPSIRLIDAALRELYDKPFVVVGFARREVQEVFPNLWVGRNLQTIALNGLTRRSAESLAKIMLGETTDSAIINNIVDRAGGNAFYLEELIRAVSDGQVETLPDTVLGMVDARIAALDPDLRRTLRAASIFGEVFWERGIKELLRDERSSNQAAYLEQLHRLELIVHRTSNRFSDEVEYGFRHALVREAAYAMLTDYDRALGHDCAAEWLLGVGEQDPMILAGHFERGNSPSKAATYYAKAAEQAMCGGDHAAAIVRAEKGLACGADREANVALRYVISASCTLTAEYAKVYDAAQLLLADKSLRGLNRARAIGYSVASAVFLGKIEVFGDLIGEMITLVPGPEEVAVVAHALYIAVAMLFVAGNPNDTLPCAGRLDELALQHPNDLLTVAWRHITRMHSCREYEHDPWQALEHNRAGVSLFEQVGARQNLAIYTAHLGLSLLQVGSFADAEKHLDGVLLNRDAEPLARMYATHFKSLLLLETARDEDALTVATSLVKDAFDASDYVILWCARMTIVNVLIVRDKLDDADRVLDELGEANAFLPFLRARFASLRSEIRRRQGRFEEAARFGADSVMIGQAGPRYNYGEDPLRLRHALALHASGNTRAAYAVIQEARTDLLTAAEKIPDETARRAYLENIGWHARTMELAKEWRGD